MTAKTNEPGEADMQTASPLNSYAKFGDIYVSLECLLGLKGPENDPALTVLADFVDECTRHSYTKPLRRIVEHCGKKGGKIKLLKRSELPDKAIVCTRNHQEGGVNVCVPVPMSNDRWVVEETDRIITWLPNKPAAAVNL